MKHNRRRAPRATNEQRASWRGLPQRAGASARRMRQDLAGRSDAMLLAAETDRRGSRMRGIPMVAIGLIAVAGMFGLVSSSVMAVNFTTSNNSFDLYSNYMDAQQAAGFLNATTKQNGSQVGVAELGVKSAKLAGLCAIAHQDMGLLGTYSLVMTAGDSVQPGPDTTSLPSGWAAGTDVNAADNDPVDGLKAGALIGDRRASAISADTLFVNADALSGYGNNVSGLNLGQSAGTVAALAGVDWPTGSGGVDPGAAASTTGGNFGLYAQQFNVANLDAGTYGLNLAGSITLPKLRIKVVSGAKGQSDCAS